MRALARATRSILIALVILALGASAVAAADPIGAGAGTVNRVAICHATGSGGYVKVAVSVSASDWLAAAGSGHIGHTDDIVPAFSAGAIFFPGRNWGPIGSAIYARGCLAAPVSSPTPSPTPSGNPSPTPSPTPSGSPSPTPSPTPNGKPDNSPTPSPTPSGSVGASASTSSAPTTPRPGMTLPPTDAAGDTGTSGPGSLALVLLALLVVSVVASLLPRRAVIRVRNRR